MMRQLLWLISTVCLWQSASCKVAKIFILAGSTNAEGRALIPHLQALIQNSTLAANNLSHLVDKNGKFVIRKDVFVSYEHERHGFWIHSPLTVEGFASGKVLLSTMRVNARSAAPCLLSFLLLCSDANHFGPEVEMGHVLGDAYKEPVIIVKAAWPEKTLAKDFRPPSAKGVTGFQWYRILSSVQKTMDNLEKILGEPYSAEIEGFVWWQGYDDILNDAYAEEYESNLNHFIKDIRRELKDEFLPFIVGELGGSGEHAFSRELNFRQMQQRVCDEGQPPMNWTTTFVRTHNYVNREKPWIDINTHYYGRGDTMIGIGGAFASGILDTIYQYEYVMPKGELEEGLSSLAGFFQAILMILMILFIGAVVVAVSACRRRGLKETWSWAIHKIRPTKEKEGGAPDDNVEELPEGNGRLA